MCKNLTSLGIILVFLVFLGCQKAPLIRDDDRPFVRTLESSKVELNSNIKLEVKGDAECLLGSDKLSEQEIYSTFTGLIERRGFSVQNQNYDYIFKLIYKTERTLKQVSSSYLSSTNYSSNYYRSGSSSFTGILMQSLLGFSSQKQETGLSSQSKTILNYIHTFGLEIYNKNGEIIWKGDSYLESPSINILDGYYFPLKLIVSNLPKDQEKFIKTKSIKESHLQIFADLKCKGFFSSIAVPYFTSFPKKINGEVNVSEFCNESMALFAGLDLPNNAEIAIPNTDENEWKSPFKTEIWENVVLLGNYEIDGKRVHILIELEDSGEGYYLVSSIKSINEADYYSYKSKREKWENFLSNYFDYLK